MANPAPTINQINAFNATQGTTIDFNIIGGTELIRSNRIYIYDLSDNSLICTHLYVSTESIHELPANTDGSIVYESGKSSADFVNGAQYYAQIQTYTDTNGTQGGSGLSVAKMFWCLVDPTLTITTIPSTISTTSYNISATYTDTSASVVSNIIQQYQFNLYSATGSLLQSSGVVVGSGTQQGTSAVYDISHNFTGLNVGSSYYVTVNVTTTQGMSVTTQSNTFTVSIDTPTLGEATVVNNACDGYISVTSNLSGEYGGSGSGEIVSFETDSENVFSKLKVELEPIQEGSGDPSPSNVRPIRGHSGVTIENTGVNIWDEEWEVGGIDHSTGKNNSVTTVIRSKDYISCVPSTTYYFANLSNAGSPYIHYYDANREFVSYVEVSRNTTFVTPLNACYIRFNMDTAYGTTYNNDISINYPSTDHDYHEYNAQTITQDFNATLTPTSTDTTPYLFKAVGDVYGDRLEDKIVGGTVAWNQHLESYTYTGALVSVDGDVITITPNDSSNRYMARVGGDNILVIQNHVYLQSVVIKSDGEHSTGFQNYQYLNCTKKTTSATWTVLTQIAKASSSGKSVVQLFSDSSTEYQIKKDSFNLFDLTQMFGSTIADYIYSLEQSQAGAGVAWFKKLFPNDYYEYNAGELLSVEGLQSHDSVGFNQWDEVLESGGLYNSNGLPYADTTWLRTKNFIPIFPSTRYYYKIPTRAQYGRLYFYDADKNFISYNGTSAVMNTTFRTPQSAHYMKFLLQVATYGSTYNHDICINLSNPTRNGEYEPYEKHSYPLDSSLTLRGIPKLDASNNLYYDGDEYTSDGKVKRKYGVVDLGTLNWGTSITNRFHTQINDMAVESGYIGVGARNDGILCPYYSCDTQPSLNAMADKTMLRNNKILYIRDTAYTDAATFKSAMQGAYLVYELATPTTETAQAYTNPQIVSKYGTLEYVTNSIVPVGHKTTYLTRDIFGGYVDLISGTLVVTHGYADLGTLDWVYDGTYPRFYSLQFAQNNDARIPESVLIEANGICTKFTAASEAQIFNKIVDNIFAIGATGTLNIRDDRSITDATTFKSAMNGVQLVYELATPQTYQLTPQQVNTLVGTNNVWGEQGNIELSYHIPITNLLVKRQDVDDVSGGWLTLYSQPISQSSDMDFTFIDFLNQYGKTYKYALVPLLTQTQSGVEVEVEGGYTVSNEVQSVFDGVFIADSTGSQKCKANVGYGNVDMNQVVGSITPIGAKYPIIITNSHNQYHNGSISGTIVPDDYYFNGNLSRIDMVNKRNELEQFLTNKRVKVIKDWNGNIWLVMIAGNVSCTFNNNYGMGIVDFSTNWTEVGDPTNQQDLQATGLINVGGV